MTMYFLWFSFLSFCHNILMTLIEEFPSGHIVFICLVG